jgi:hypothetical protein
MLGELNIDATREIFNVLIVELTIPASYRGLRMLDGTHHSRKFGVSNGTGCDSAACMW